MVTKTSQTPKEVAKSFQFQVEPWDCDPTQIYNLLSELRRRHGAGVPALDLNGIRHIIPAALEGNRHLRAVANLKRRLAPRGYSARAIFGSVESSWATVLRILRDEGTSYPMVGVSPEYWTELDFRF